MNTKKEVTQAYLDQLETQKLSYIRAAGSIVQARPFAYKEIDRRTNGGTTIERKNNYDKAELKAYARAKAKQKESDSIKAGLFAPFDFDHKQRAELSRQMANYQSILDDPSETELHATAELKLNQVKQELTALPPVVEPTHILVPSKPPAVELTKVKNEATAKPTEQGEGLRFRGKVATRIIHRLQEGPVTFQELVKFLYGDDNLTNRGAAQQNLYVLRKTLARDYPAVTIQSTNENPEDGRVVTYTLKYPGSTPVEQKPKAVAMETKKPEVQPPQPNTPETTVIGGPLTLADVDQLTGLTLTVYSKLQSSLKNLGLSAELLAQIPNEQKLKEMELALVTMVPEPTRVPTPAEIKLARKTLATKLKQLYADKNASKREDAIEILAKKLPAVEHLLTGLGVLDSNLKDKLIEGNEKPLLGVVDLIERLLNLDIVLTTDKAGYVSRAPEANTSKRVNLGSL